MILCQNVQTRLWGDLNPFWVSKLFTSIPTWGRGHRSFRQCPKFRSSQTPIHTCRPHSTSVGRSRSWQVKLRQVNLGQVKFGKVKYGQVKSGQIKSGHVKSVQAIQVGTGQVMSVFSRQARSIWNMSIKVGTSWVWAVPSSGQATFSGSKFI